MHFVLTIFRLLAIIKIERVEVHLKTENRPLSYAVYFAVRK